jgi:hypothetical protein
MTAYVEGIISEKTTAYKILRVGYYWPTIFTDIYRGSDLASNVKDL